MPRNDYRESRIRAGNEWKREMAARSEAGHAGIPERFPPKPNYYRNVREAELRGDAVQTYVRDISKARERVKCEGGCWQTNERAM